MEREDKRNLNGIYSKKLRAGKRRTYFFDIRSTKYDDYFITITESKRKFNGDGYERHKIFLYKEDFNKFVESMNEAVDIVKNELMPDFDFSSFDRELDPMERVEDKKPYREEPQPAVAAEETVEEASTEMDAAPEQADEDSAEPMEWDQ